MAHLTVRRRRPRAAVRFRTECEQIVFDVTEGVPDLTKYYGSSLEDDDIGWYVVLEIICPPKVILVLNRDVEIEEEEEIRDERKQ